MAAPRLRVWSSTPDLWLTRPAPPAHAIDRPGLASLITDSVERFRVTLFLAPAGFGKTAALSAWAAQSRRRVAWLSLTPADHHAAHLQRGLSTALEAVTQAGPHGDDTGLSEGATAPSVEGAVLIVDDLQFADSVGSRKVLVSLLQRADLGVRLVLSGRFEPHLGLSRLRANGELGEFAAELLAFSVDEVQRAAAALGRELDDEQAAQLIVSTGGWPVSVRLALMSEAGNRPGIEVRSLDAHLPQFVDYLVENLLDQLPARLAAFVPRACVCDQLTGSLAQALSADTQGAQLLEEALARGLPLERRILPGGEPVYFWHPVMAQAGRALLMRRDPDLISELHRKSARHLAAADPYEAVLHALSGRDPELAAGVILSEWLAVVLRGDSELVEELCGRLPSPWSEDPEILTVRATCRRNAGDAQTAAQLANRAEVALLGLDAPKRRSFEVTRSLARLFLADEEGDLSSACGQALRLLEQPTGFDGPLRACATLLVGWSKMRLRQSADAVRLLNEAIQRCRAEGLDDLAERARADLLFSKAYSGDFNGALAEVGAAPSAREDSIWRRAEGGIDVFTKGWVSFWSGDCDNAMAAFRKAAATGGALTSFEPLARVWLVHAALTRGNASEIAEAEKVLDPVPEETIQGLPWPHYKAIAQAGIALSRGDRDLAVRLLDQAAETEAFTPAARVFAAELNWLCRRPAHARAQTEQVLRGPDYLRASGLVVLALCARDEGDVDAAGELLEEALGLGVSLGITRPFQVADQAMAELLVEHAARGTHFEVFLGEQIARHVTRLPALVERESLSAREQEILGYLATTMSAAEIREALFVSQNTLKTHLRSIYRKLGVDNRRDAARLFRPAADR